MQKNNNVIFVDIDTQVDFMCPSGKLYVQGAEGIVPNIERLMDFASQNGVSIISSVDVHAPDDPEFKDFPPHCIVNTPGVRKIQATITRLEKVLIRTEEELMGQALEKEQFVGKQLIIEKHTFDIFSNKNTKKILKLLDASHYVVFGVATEYCVKVAVMGLLCDNYDVYIVKDAIKPVAVEGGLRAIETMEKGGARLVSTDQVLSQSLL